jgi:hypothetical protein
LPGWRPNPWFVARRSSYAALRRDPSAPPGSPRIRERQERPARTWSETGRPPQRRGDRHIRCTPFPPAHWGPKGGEKLVAAARIGGYDGDYADHLSFSACWSASRPEAADNLTRSAFASKKAQRQTPLSGRDRRLHPRAGRSPSSRRRDSDATNSRTVRRGARGRRR